MSGESRTNLPAIVPDGMRLTLRTGSPVPRTGSQGEDGSGYTRSGAGLRHSPSGLPRPDWLMFGVPRPDGSFRLYASREIHGADLLAVSGSFPYLEVTGISVGAEMRQTLIIDGASYGECLARMAEIWRNWDADGREITS